MMKRKALTELKNLLEQFIYFLRILAVFVILLHVDAVPKYSDERL